MSETRLSHPTLLVPGIAAGNAPFLPFRRWLRQRGIDAECWQGSPLLYTRSMDDHADALVESIEAMPHERLTLMGWSYGGYIGPLAASRLRRRGREIRVIAFATPYDGTDFALAAALTDRLGLHVREMIPGHPMLLRVATVIASLPHGSFYALNGRFDILARATQRNVPKRCRIEGPWAHSSLLFDADLWGVIHSYITRP